MGAVKPHKTPKMDESTTWDKQKAITQLKNWATNDKGEIDFSKYRQGFAWYDTENAEVLGSYKLPHHYVEEGKLKVCWAGVRAAAAALMGARGGVGIPKEDIEGVKKHLAVHYKQFNKIPPWEVKESTRRIDITLKLQKAQGNLYKAILIKSGITFNKELIPPEVLEAALPLFKDLPVGAFYIGSYDISQDNEVVELLGHPKEWGDMVGVGNIIGIVREVEFVDGAVMGVVEIFDERYQKIIDKFLESNFSRMGLSIVAWAKGEFNYNKGLYIINEIDDVLRVDLTLYPAAGGSFIERISQDKEAIKMVKNDKNLKRVKEEIEDKKDTKPIKEAEDEKINKEAEGGNKIKEAVKEKEELNLKEAKEDDVDLENLKAEMEELKESLRKERLIREVLKRRLNNKVEMRLIEWIEKGKIQDEKDIEEFIGLIHEDYNKWEGAIMQNKAYNRYKILRAGLLKSLGHTPESEEERKIFEEAPDYVGLEEFIEELGGYEAVKMFRNGDVKEIKLTKIREDVSTTDLSNVLGAILNARLQQEYKNYGGDDLLKLVKAVSVKSLKEQKIYKVSGLSGVFSEVSEGQAYPDAGGAVEEAVSYSPKKYGAILKISMETLLGDNLNAIRQIINKLARKAKRTLYQFIVNLIENYTSTGVNTGIIYDGNHLYDDTNHHNLLSEPLSYDALKDAYLKMRKQTELGSGEPLGLAPAHLLVPRDLELVALDLITQEFAPVASGNSNIRNIFRNKLNVVVSDYLHSPNNWYLLADPKQFDFIEIGFVGGRTTPEIITANQATDYDLFYSDAIAYKIRFAFGGAIIDYRGLVGSIQE